MKKLLVLLALFALPLFATAADSPEVLLTSAGELFSISSEVPAEGSASQATTHLVLTERRAGQTIRQIVPATMERGQHFNAVLGYDTESGTLFVFWIKHLGALYNQLFFVTRDATGTWSEPTEFGSPFNYRENLRVAVTRKVAGTDGQPGSVGLSVHATWWEFDTRTALESAQYHMLSIENGHVVDVAELNLSQFVDFENVGAEDLDRSVLKYPMIAPSAKQDSVLLTFGSLENRNFSQVRITPKMKGEGRLRVPIGKRAGSFPAPRMAVNAGASVEGVFGESDTLAFYTVGEGALRYAILKDGQWSDTRAITLDENVSNGLAVGALRKMVAEQ
ncbi:MAG: hypothetical protein M3P06_04460 [Acidobacteriota bacterium]|nr:hypothetical protein [Acidobacteriota bacterium]